LNLGLSYSHCSSDTSYPIAYFLYVGMGYYGDFLSAHTDGAFMFDVCVWQI